MKILFVDDDASVLDGLKRMLFAQKGQWEMDFCADPTEALSMVENQYDLVVSDLQMPDVNGVQLLEHVQKVSPATIRFILTGVIDHPLHGKALRTAHQVIGKPCRPETIKDLIQRACNCMGQLQDSTIAPVLTKLQTLPSLPEAYQRVLDFLGSPVASPRGLGKLISEDMGMSAKIMQLANSAYYGRPGKIHNPIQAVIYLGMKTVEAMVLTEGIFSRLDEDVSEAYMITGLQSHCTRVGMLARKICSDLQLPPDMAEQSSMAGILHDAGKIIMLSELTDLYSESLAVSRYKGLSLYEAEKMTLGFTHAQLGAALLQLWTMPADIIESTMFHESPWLTHLEEEGASQALRLPDVVYLANTIDEHYCVGWTEGSEVDVCEDYLDRYGLSEQYQSWLSNHLAAQRQEPEYAEQR